MPSEPPPDSDNTEPPHRLPEVPPVISIPPTLSEVASASLAPPRLAANAPDIFQGRLHPMTLVFSVWNLIRGFLIPAIIVFFVSKNRSFMGGFFLIFVAIPLVVSIIRYFTFTYRIQGGELITRHGLLSRTERNIPLARVQDIRIEQGVLHRLLGMADVNVETAGGRGSEASLSVLSKAEAERLRAAVFEQASAARAAAGAQPAQALPREIIRQLTVRDLVKAGLTSNQMASVLALLAVGFSLVDDVLPKDSYQRLTQAFSHTVDRVMQQGIETAWIQVLAGVLLLLLIGIVFSVVGSVVMFYGFTLARSGEDLHRSYGLITRRASSLPRKRIQVLKIEEKLLRRFFRLATLRADTAGSRADRSEEGTGGRDVLLPVIPLAEVEPLLPVFFPNLDTGAADWRQVSRRAIRRGTLKGASVCVILSGIAWWLQRDWIDVWPLAFIPLVYALNVMSYRHLGYWLGEKFFRTRRGWLSRATHIVPIRNAQAIVVRQTPFDRRHGVATLIVDTAGQAYTGGGPRIDNVPWTEVIATARTLAQRAAETRYRW